MRLALATALATFTLLAGCGTNPIDTTCPNDGDVVVTSDTVGTGLAVFDGALVRVTYAGRLDDGSVFDQGERVIFQLNSLIRGWRTGMLGEGLEGIEPMREGGKRSVIIPPNHGYGAVPQAGLAACSQLEFDIDLFEVIY